MSHDLRQALGYRKLPSGDPEEMRLRAEWYKAKGEHDAAGFPDSGPAYQYFQHATDEIASYLWQRTLRIIESDRAKHPKAQRNQPVPARDPDDISTRVIP